MTDTAREYWTEAPLTGRVREVPCPRPQRGEVLIETLASGISAGTETVVHRGKVPPSVAHLMQAPHQLGDLPFPVSHGYLNVGVVRSGPEHLLGRRVFTLGGHRSHLVVDENACHVLDQGTPTERALLGGLAEVGLNAIWEAEPTLGDRVAVVGGGLVGLLTALLVDKIHPARLEVVETDPQRRSLALKLGLAARSPGDASVGNDVVFHTSAQPSGLETALELTGDDGTVLEMSWYGEERTPVSLGADFHARRLRLVASQVGAVATPRRTRRTRRERLATALSLLDERFDTLITGHCPLEKLPELMNDIAESKEWTRGHLLHVVTYGGETE